MSSMWVVVLYFFKWSNDVGGVESEGCSGPFLDGFAINADSASASASSSVSSAMAAKPQSEKKRLALQNITNLRPTGSLNQRPPLASSKPMFVLQSCFSECCACGGGGSEIIFGAF